MKRTSSSYIRVVILLCIVAVAVLLFRRCSGDRDHAVPEQPVGMQESPAGSEAERDSVVMPGVDAEHADSSALEKPVVKTGVELKKSKGGYVKTAPLVNTDELPSSQGQTFQDMGRQLDVHPEVIDRILKPRYENQLKLQDSLAGYLVDTMMGTGHIPPMMRSKQYRVLGLNFSLPRLPKPKKRMDRGIVNQLYIPKGYMTGGMHVSYTTYDNEDFELFRTLNWTGTGYSLQMTPYFAYFYKNNQAVGGQFTYRRNLLKVNSIGLNLGDDMNLKLEDIYGLEHSYFGTVFHRSYVGIGNGKRFGLFNETRLSFGGGEGKFVMGKNQSVDGTYSRSFEMQVGIKPGLSVFIQNNVAIEAAVGVLGFKYKRINEVINQVSVGSRSTSSANFKFDLFSISLGMSVYLP